MLLDFVNGQTGVILRVKIRNSSVTTGAGLTGLSSASTGLIISTIADNEAAATAYTVAGATIETITTLGTYAAPTATKCRFKEVDATNHKGVYEIQIADARFAVSGAKSLLISISGATNAAECDVVIPLRAVNPYSGTNFGLSGLPTASPGASGGVFIAGTNAATTITTALTTTFTGNVTGSVGSVTGSVGSVTGAVGSVTGGVTVTTNNDKTNYTLASSGLNNIVIETGVDARQAICIMASALAGLSSGVDVGSPVFKGINSATTRIAATASAGNRSVVTLTLP